MPSAAAPLSMWELFLHADWIVKFVMVGLLITSVAVWAIAIDKLLLYSRTRKAMDGFEQAFWSGQSLDELYRSLASRPTHSPRSRNASPRYRCGRVPRMCRYRTWRWQSGPSW